MVESDQEKRRAKLQQLRERRGGRRRVPAQQASDDADGNRPGGLLRMIAQRRGKGGEGPLAGNGPRLGGGARKQAGGGAGGQQDRPLLRQLLAQRRGGQGEEGLSGLRERLGSGDPGKLRERIEQRIEKLRGLIRELDERDESSDGHEEDAAPVGAGASGSAEARKVAKKP